MSGALIASMMAPRIGATITRTVYIEQGNPTVAVGETWAVVHANGRGGTPAVTAPAGLRCGGGGRISSLISVGAGEVIGLGTGGVTVGATQVVSVGDGGPGTGAAATSGFATRHTGVDYASITRQGTGGVADPLNAANPEDAGQAGISSGGIVLSRELTPGSGSFVAGVERGGEPDSLVTFYTSDPR